MYTQNTFAQTQLIAFKSHSGNMHDFVLSPDDNFGIYIPEFTLDSVIKISDTAVVEFSGKNDKGRMTFRRINGTIDTIYKSKVENYFLHKAYFDPNINKDSLEQLGPEIKYVGFEKKPQPQKVLKKHTHKKRINESIPMLPTGNGNTHNPAIIATFAVLFALLLTLVLWSFQLKKLAVQSSYTA